MDIILIASGAAFAFAVLLFISVAVCIFLYCLSRKKKGKPVVARRTNETAVDLETTPTASDTTGQTSVDQVSDPPPVQETAFGISTLYPRLPVEKEAEKETEKEAELDSEEPPPYSESASLPPQNHYQVCLQ